MSGKQPPVTPDGSFRMRARVSGAPSMRRTRALFSGISPDFTPTVQQRAASGDVGLCPRFRRAHRGRSEESREARETMASFEASETSADCRHDDDRPSELNRWLLRPALALQLLADIVPGGVVPIALLVAATILLKLLKAVAGSRIALLQRQWAAGGHVASNIAIESMIAVPTIGSRRFLLAHGCPEERHFVASLLGRSSWTWRRCSRPPWHADALPDRRDDARLSSSAVFRSITCIPTVLETFRTVPARLPPPLRFGCTQRRHTLLNFWSRRTPRL